MRVLPDVLAPRLSVVFAAPAVGECAAARGHYYAGSNNAFWRLLHESGLTPRPMDPTEDATLPTYGLGLADVVKDPDEVAERGPTFAVDAFAARIERCAPRWVGFNGKMVGQAVGRALGHREVTLGPADWTIGGAEVFVLPSSSGANRRRDYDGRATRVEWWRELADYVR